MNTNAQEVTAGVRPGDILAGKYRVDRVLGMGGMGVVVAAHHLHLDDRVAIKFLLPEALANEEAVARFAREAQAAVRIKSEHVARVTDVGKLDNGSPYMVMEYLEGSDLGARLEQQGRLPVDQTIEFVLQACEAIAEAHAIGIVHRDLKPANLFVIRRPDGSPSVKVLDFGISKRTGLGASGPNMTRTSAVLGSPLYMSPEQMRSAKDVDPRSDIWSLGVILYELVGGDAPFLADSLPELVLKIVSDAPASLRTKVPQLPEGLERAIFKCLEKDRARRFESVGALAVALAPYGPARVAASVERIDRILQAAGAPPSAVHPATAQTQQAEAKSANTVASWGQTGASSRPRKTVGLVAASALAIVVLAAVGYAVSGKGRSAAVSAASEAPPPVTTPVVTATVGATAAPAVPASSGAPAVSAAPSAEPITVAPSPSPPPRAAASAKRPSPPRPRAPSARDVYDDRK